MMKLEQMIKKVLALIEELDEDNELLTGDADIAAKINDVINQVQFELARIKKIPRCVDMVVSRGQTVTLEDVSHAVGKTVYQVDDVRGVAFRYRGDGTAIKVEEDGTLEIDCYVYPAVIDRDTDGGHELDLSPDALEIMPYGVAADLLKSDVSAQYGSVYATRYESMKQQLDPRYHTGSILVEGGVEI